MSDSPSSRLRAARVAANVAFAVGAGLCAGSCTRGGGSDSMLPPAVALTAAFGGLTFPSALKLLQHPTIDARWYVVEQGGAVETFLDTDPAGTRTTAVTVTGIVMGGESGLLGMAFHPDFATTGEIFLSYVADTGGSGTSIVARYLSADNGLTFTPDPDPIVLSLVQPFGNHKGGDIAFGPDEYLYVAFGDGGGTGDPNAYGQNINVWFGKILRIDPDPAHPYVVPPDNPFVGIAGADEIWAYGLRNPWRMSFDPATGELWLGDVGQGYAEEIDLIVRGGNYGWGLAEGDVLYPSLVPGTIMGTIAPRAVHHHPTFESITGGYVYHGAAIPMLQGMYVYGDFVMGRIYEFDPTMPGMTPAQIWRGSHNISSFGQGRDGEIYVVSYSGAGSIYRIDPLP